MNEDKQKIQKPQNDPGGEAAEPSPGHKERDVDPTKEDLEKVDQMYRDKAKTLAKQSTATPEGGDRS